MAKANGQRALDKFNSLCPVNLHSSRRGQSTCFKWNLDSAELWRRKRPPRSERPGGRACGASTLLAVRGPRRPAGRGGGRSRRPQPLGAAGEARTWKQYFYLLALNYRFAEEQDLICNGGHQLVLLAGRVCRTKRAEESRAEQVNKQIDLGGGGARKFAFEVTWKSARMRPCPRKSPDKRRLATTSCAAKYDDYRAAPPLVVRWAKNVQLGGRADRAGASAAIVAGPGERAGRAHR